jgi:uncharacterized protein YdhG (YjbR/CyaY superfamily)
MAGRRPTTIAEYIQSAPVAGRPHLRKLYEILTAAAPHAEQTIKWGVPFFVEPRFLFAFSAFKKHLDFTPTAGTLERFRKELAKHPTTKNTLQVPYDRPLPAALIRKIAKFRVRQVRESDSDSFW